MLIILEIFWTILVKVLSLYILISYDNESFCSSELFKNSTLPGLAFSVSSHVLKMAGIDGLEFILNLTTIENRNFS